MRARNRKSILFFIVPVIMAFFAASVRAEDGKIFQANLEELIHLYPEVYGGGDAVVEDSKLTQLDILIDDLMGQVFSDPGSYVEKLKLIDQKFSQSPQAISDLARSLQSKFEKDFGQSARVVALNQANTVKTCTTVGAVAGSVGLLLTGLVMLVKPEATPRYFRIFRFLATHYPAAGSFLPFAGALAGHYAGFAVFARFARDAGHAVGPAPAEILRLGVDSDDASYDLNDLGNDLLLLTGSLAAGEVVVQTLLWLAKAGRCIEGVSTIGMATPSPEKVTPTVVVWAVGILVGLVLDRLITLGVDHYQRADLEAQLKTAVKNFDETLYTGGGSGKLLTRASQVSTLALRLSTQFLDRSLFGLIHEYGEKIEKLAHEYDQNPSPDLQARLRGLQQELIQALMTLKIPVSEPPLVQDHIMERNLANQLREGEITARGDELLLQVIALFKQSKSKFVMLKADALMNHLRNYYFMIAVLTGTTPTERVGMK